MFRRVFCLIAVFISGPVLADEIDDFIYRVADNLGSGGNVSNYKNSKITFNPAKSSLRKKEVSFNPNKESDVEEIEAQPEPEKSVEKKDDVIEINPDGNMFVPVVKTGAKVLSGGIDYSNNYKIRISDSGGKGTYGSSRDHGKRKHAGVDLLVPAGSNVPAITSGVVTRFFFPYSNDHRFHGVEIKLDNGDKMKYMYVDSSVKVGQRIEKGQSIGSAENLLIKYKPGMQNHVHFEYFNQGKRVDPTFLFQ